MPKRRRRPFTPRLKALVVLDVLTGLRSQAQATRQYTLNPGIIARRKTPPPNVRRPSSGARIGRAKTRTPSPSLRGWWDA